MLSIGLVGYGFAAQTFHVPLINTTKAFELRAVVSSKPEKVRTNHPGIRVFDSTRDMLHETNVDVVLITTPNTQHHPLALECLHNGRHVILEKPMVCTGHQGEELTELAEKNGLILSVFHNRRWDGDFLTVSKLLKEGVLGTVTCFESHFDRFRPVVRERWREKPGKGSGFWYDLGSHLLDQALCLFGMPTALTARCFAQRPQSETIDYFHVMLHYPSCEVILHGSCFSAGPNRRFHIEGTKGSYIKFGLDPQEEQLKKGLNPDNPLFGRENKENYGTLYTANDSIPIQTEPGCYIDYYDTLAEAIGGTCAPPVTANQGTMVIRLIELAEQSSIEGRTMNIPAK